MVNRIQPAGDAADAAAGVRRRSEERLRLVGTHVDTDARTRTEKDLRLAELSISRVVWNSTAIRVRSNRYWSIWSETRWRMVSPGLSSGSSEMNACSRMALAVVAFFFAQAWGGFTVETLELPRQWGIRIVHVRRP